MVLGLWGFVSFRVLVGFCFMRIHFWGGLGAGLGAWCIWVVDAV